MRFWELTVGSSWPRSESSWLNIDVARFVWRVRRRLDGAPQTRPRRAAVPSELPIRLACVGEFARLSSFGAPALFRGPISGVSELHVFDFEYLGNYSEHLRPLASGYHAYRQDGDGTAQAAADINAVQADLVVHFGRLGKPAYDLVDRLDAPCVAHMSTGSLFLFHDGVDFTVNGQPQADYFLRDDRLFSGLAHAYSGTERVYQGGAFWDPEGLDPEGALPWEAREPKIVVHGSLYKAASPVFLDAILGLLREDGAVSLVLMGKDNGNALAAIRSAAAAEGVEQQVVYDGAFQPFRGEGGAVEDPRRLRMLEHLHTARLAPNPFPLGGGSSRAEAYGCGTPTVHMALRSEPEAWGKAQLTTVDAPGLNLPEATATSLDGYLALCRSCLYDPSHAARVTAAQRAVFDRVTDPARFWKQLLGFYGDWRRQTYTRT